MSRQKKLRPDENALGNHTVFIETLFGKILKYATYILSRFNPSGCDEIKRVDLFGEEHYNKNYWRIHPNSSFTEKGIQGGVRNAVEDEIPGRNKNG